MNRRNFLKNAAPFGMLPLLGSGLPFSSLRASSPFLLNPCDVTDRSIVLVYLNGGNDIFNTTVPLNQLSTYHNIRPDIGLPDSSLIELDSSLPDEQRIGLHPILTSFKDLYDGGKLSIIQGAGYENINGSHFKSLDNWLQGTTGGSEKYTEGWLGRFLDDRYPSYVGLPFAGEPDPLALVLKRMSDAGLITGSEHSLFTTLSSKDEQNFYSVISPLSGEPIANIPNSDFGDKLNFLKGVATGLNVYSGRVQQVFNAGTNSGNAGYPDTDLAYQLKTVARLLSGGSRTKVFMVSIGGFDLHGNLVLSNDTTQGSHAGILQDTFDSIKAFQNDLEEQSLDDNVMTFVFSEFGRKAIQNNGFGCDHGTLNSMFLVGKGVEPGVIGNNIDLSDLDNGKPNNAQMQHTYHEVYATLIQDWLGADDTSVNEGVFYNAATPYTTQKLNLINTANIVPSSCYFTPVTVSVCACAQVKVFLEGFYDDAIAEMKTDLASSASFPSSQPYNIPPFNYSGAENFTNLPTDTVDWLLLELRDAEDLTTVVERQAVLLRKDGFVIQTDGTSGANFPNAPEGNYHLAIFHRNHLGILSSLPIETDNTSFVLDFSASTLAAKGRSQLKQIGNTYVMQVGDLSGNQIIDNDDYNYQQMNQGTSVGYDKGDLNGDENIDSADYDLWSANRYKLGELRQ